MVNAEAEMIDIINTEKLHELYGSDETAQDIIHMFIDRSSQLFSDLKEACGSDNLEALRRICHKGIGQSRYIAAPLLEEALRDLQEASASERQNFLDVIDSMLQQIRHAYT
ncbi:MAG: Hpt domain-containing protein [Pseudomonadota bacterium]|nr:Hpt domain-containing protein [Pseudomonadota bacterium]